MLRKKAQTCVDLKKNLLIKGMQRGERERERERQTRRRREI